MRGRVNSVTFSSGSNVPDGKTVTPVNDVVLWQQCAGIASPSYDTLAGVLSDNSLLLTLMANNNAVDYLVRSTEWATERALIPTMTSNTTPSGVASCYKDNTSGGDAYLIFDSNDTTSCDQFYGGAGDITKQWIQYEFENKTNVTKARFYVDNSNSSRRFRSCKLQGSDDGVTFTDITTLSDSSNQKELIFTFANNYNYKIYRIQMVSSSGGQKVIFYTVQFYSAAVPLDSNAMSAIGLDNYASNTLLANSTWCNAICASAYSESVLNCKVPAMTSNTTPSGVVSVSASTDSERTSWKAFNGSTASDADSMQFVAAQSSGTVTYQFPYEVALYYVTVYNFANSGSNTPRNSKIGVLSGSTDGSNWTTIYDFNDDTTYYQSAIISNPSNTKCSYYRLQLKNSSGYANGVGEIQYYCRKDV